MEFAKRGHRRKKGFGLYYRGKDTPYTLYYADRFDGEPWEKYGRKPHWLAIYAAENLIIGYHRTRKAAERCCMNHALTSKVSI